MHFSKSSEYVIYNNSLFDLFDLHLIYSKSKAFYDTSKSGFAQ